MQKSDGMNYAPQGKAEPVVQPGEFKIGVMDLEHGHIFGMVNGLTEAGAEVKWVYDKDPAKVKNFVEKFPGVMAAESAEQILNDPEIRMVAAAGIPSKRCERGLQVMAAGKDYFCDKAPFTTLEQLEAAKEMCERTGKKYMVYYSERLHVESAIYAGKLIEEGAIGRVIQVIGTGPHRIGDPKARPDWFWDFEQYGGLLCDIGSHQIEQYLYFSGAKDAKVVKSQVGNYAHKDIPKFYDFGDCMLQGDNGTSMYFRVDWFTPDGLGTWGDGRTIILGTEGYIELRKYINVGTHDGSMDHVFLVNKEGEQHMEVHGKVGFPYFGQLILDCIYRTEKAMTQEHAFKAAELCVRAQIQATVLE